MAKITLKHYDYDKNETVQDGEVDTYAVAKALDAKTFGMVLEDYANTYSSSFKRGTETGEILQTSHHSLQRSMIVELCGIITGLSEQQYTDARNASAIALAKKIAELVKKEGFGPMI